jgi:hypothetical protein
MQADLFWIDRNRLPQRRTRHKFLLSERRSTDSRLKLPLQ